MIKGLFRNIFPPRRVALSFSDSFPLISFVVLFCGLMGYFYYGAETLDLTKFWPLWFLVSCPWVWWLGVVGYSGLQGRRRHVALFLRLCLIGLFVVLLCEPRSKQKSEQLTIVFVMDFSASVDEDERDKVFDHMLGVAGEKKINDKVALVVFGGDAEVELPPDRSFPFSNPRERSKDQTRDRSLNTISLINKSATDLQSAISTARSLIGSDEQGRIILYTDGIQTQGTLGTLLDELRSTKIAVDVMEIAYPFSEKNEVWLERLDLPSKVKEGETYEAAVILSSLRDGDGTLKLYENEELIFEDKVSYRGGKTRLPVPLTLRETGLYEYRATIEPTVNKKGMVDDGWTENNKALNYLYLAGEGRIMLVAEDERDAAQIQKALIETKHKVEIFAPEEFPQNALGLRPYDVVAFVNVGRELFSMTQMQSLKDAVEHQGVGFMMVGGENSFGPGGYHKTPIEEILPVSMDVTQRKVMPKGALVIVLHTCEYANGNSSAKEITRKAIKVLSPQDEVGVLAFMWQGGDKWIVPLQPARNYSQFVKNINKASPEDMPSFVPSMKAGLAALKKSDASVKHMIIISDGDPQPPSPQLLQAFVAAKVTVSTVAINPHNTLTAMRGIADRTNGKYYFANDASDLPQIFIKEAKTLSKNMIVNKKVVPTLQDYSPVVKGFDAFPQLHGYVMASAKDKAELVLQIAETEDKDPILATMRVGLGRTAAFMSDLSTNWGKDWVAWEQYRAFVQQLFTTVSRPNKVSNLMMQSYAVGDTGYIVVNDYAEESEFLDVYAQVQAPGDPENPENLIDVKLEQKNARKYVGKFKIANGQGRYQINGVGKGLQKEGQTDEDVRNEYLHGGFVVPYSPEFLRFRPDRINLRNIQEATNGRYIKNVSDSETYFNFPREIKIKTDPVFEMFLLVLAVLVLMDVGIRRVQMDMSVVLGWLSVKPRERGGSNTMSALKSRKTTGGKTDKKQEKQSRKSKSQERVERKKIQEMIREQQVSDARKVDVVKGKEPKGDAPESTTSRLLKSKRKFDD